MKWCHEAFEAICLNKTPLQKQTTQIASIFVEACQYLPVFPAIGDCLALLLLLRKPSGSYFGLIGA